MPECAPAGEGDDPLLEACKYYADGILVSIVGIIGKCQRSKSLLPAS